MGRPPPARLVDGAPLDRRGRRARRRRRAARALRRAAARGALEEHADRPRVRGRPRSGTGAARLPRRPAARRRRAGGGGRRSRRRHERRALDRRPARRDRELPLRDPPVGRQRGLRGRRRTGRRGRPRPAARRDLRRHPRRAGHSRRRAGGRVEPRRPGDGDGGDRVRLRRRGAGRRRPRSPPACFPACATCAAWAARRWTWRGPRAGATTPTTSADCSPGTAPRANCCAPGRDSSCASCVRTERFPPGCSSPRRRWPVRSASSSGRKEHVFRPARRMFPLACRLGAVPSSYSPGQGSLRK